MKSPFGNLYVPSAAFITHIKELYEKFVENYNIVTETNVMQKFLNILCNVQFSHLCTDFPKMYLLKLSIRVRIYYTLKFVNRNLKNTKEGIRKTTILNHI